MRGDNIEQTTKHSAGAYAKCFACGRYSDDPSFFIGQEVICDCGKSNMWIFKFVSPDGLSRWSGNSTEVKKELNKLGNLMDSIENSTTRPDFKESNLMTADLETIRKILWLIMTENIFLSDYNREKDIHDDGIYPVINCNDFFCPGSDSEPLYLKDIDIYTKVVKRWPNDVGSLAWCAVQRDSKPWRNIEDIALAKDCLEASECIMEMIKARAEK
jgi:hypothetical protein